MKKNYIITLGLICLALVGWKTTSNYLQVGDGTNAANKKVIFDIGSGATNPQIAYDITTNKLTFTNDGVNTKNLGSGSGSGSGVNLLDNPGCENGTSTPDNWTASGGSLTRTTTAANVGYETAACSFDASGSGQFVKPTDVLVPEFLEGNPCVAEITYKADTITAGDYILYVEDSTGTDLTSSVSLNATNGSWVRANVAFTCPSTASIRFKIESAVANPPAILFDQTHLGSMKNDFLAQNPVEIVADAYFATTAACNWARTNTVQGGLTADTDCPAITVLSSSPIVSIDTADTDLPQIKFNSLPAGTYEVKAIFTGRNGTAANYTTYSLTDGTLNRGHQGGLTNTNTDEFPRTVVATFSHSGGAKTFGINCSASAGNCQVNNDTAEQRVNFLVTRYPSTSTSNVTLETQGWFIDANWRAGTDVTIGTAAVASFTEISHASGALTLNTGSATTGVQVPCSTTNPPTGLTCSAGNEVIGVAFTPPYVGQYEACITYATQVQLDAAVSAQQNFQFNETPTNAVTITTTGKNQNVRNIGAAANQVFTTPVSFCQSFYFSSVSQKVLRLMYTQSVVGTPDAAEIRAIDATIDVHIVVRPLTQNFPQAVALADLPVPTTLLDANATRYGLKEYHHGTTYNSGLAPTVTLSSGGGTLSSVQRAVFIPYQTQAGVWRMKFNVAVTLSSVARTSAVLAVNGITSPAFYQGIIAYADSGGAVAAYGYVVSSTNTLTANYASSTATVHFYSGDIELASKPTWAY